jgi:phytoene dehydrogenase-like protein
MTQHYDAVIIGAGMSGLACAIRLAMFDKKVLVLEKHSIAGGLNSYYQRRNETTKGIRLFDVGLHALTNFALKGAKGKPLTKLLKQLRINYDDLKLQPQTYSLIQFPGKTLQFSNDFELLKQSVLEQFPHQIDAFLQFTEQVMNFNELDLSLDHQSARAVLSQSFSDKQLIEMLLAPLLIYGSAWEDDMDFAQFVVMFKSLYMEGFARPQGGVRTIINLLLSKIKSTGAELRYKSSVEKILTNSKGECCGVRLSNGEEISAKLVFSSMGLPETMQRLDSAAEISSKFSSARAGELSFMESILIYDQKIMAPLYPATINFYNNRDVYHYRKSTSFYDDQSAVVCFPDNYHPQDNIGEGIIRVTYIANYELWKKLERADYLAKKAEVLASSQKLIEKLIPDFKANLLNSDVFSPTTVERYTWHKKGAVYGSPDKARDGRTDIANLYIIGTDQGFLGIVGAMLSGISIANLYGLMENN